MRGKIGDGSGRPAARRLWIWSRRARPRCMDRWGRAGRLGRRGRPGLQDRLGRRGRPGLQDRLGPLGLQGRPGPLGLQGRPGPLGLQGRLGPRDHPALRCRSSRRDRSARPDSDRERPDCRAEADPMDPADRRRAVPVPAPDSGPARSAHPWAAWDPAEPSREHLIPSGRPRARPPGRERVLRLRRIAPFRGEQVPESRDRERLVERVAVSAAAPWLRGWWGCARRAVAMAVGRARSRRCPRWRTEGASPGVQRARRRPSRPSPPARCDLAPRLLPQLAGRV